MVLEFIKSLYKSGGFLYSKGGYVLGFYTDPDDKKGTMDSVSPERIFGEERDDFSSLPSQSNLVKDTS